MIERTLNGIPIYWYELGNGKYLVCYNEEYITTSEIPVTDQETEQRKRDLTQRIGTELGNILARLLLQSNSKI